ncbi:MAG: 50S ribosomal protein L5 [Patescibacteria group bacterium]|jgi:large subunit ribosomal protein L5
MLKSKYLKLVPELKQTLGLKSISAVPKLQKVVIHVSAGRAIGEPKLIETVVEELKKITGQKPVVTKAKKSVAGFKLREGVEIGVMVTLRGNRMYDFLDKLVNVTLPRVRDFQGLPPHKGFDKNGSFNLGIREHIAFPEVVFENVEKILSLQITIVTTAKTPAHTKALLVGLGFPFQTESTK